MPELLRGLALARPVLDRLDAVRSDVEQVRQLWSSDGAQVVVLRGEHVATNGDPDAPELLLQPAAQLPVDADSAFFLGVLDGKAYFAVDRDPPGWAQDGRTLREIGVQLRPLDAELFTTALALAQWHRRHPRCSVCGEPTRPQRAGWVRRCPLDSTEHFPRTDPAVIVLVLDPDDRALLGRRAGWPPGWFSTLAGFIEPGESAESSVVREVAEESGVHVQGDSVEFLGSQPWPFPSSLMLGFHARAESGADPHPDGDEIVEARWYSRAEFSDAARASELRVPSAVSIAHHLIRHWYGEEIPAVWSRR